MLEVSFTTRYFAPFEEGADERELIREIWDQEIFESADELARVLEREGLQRPSMSGPYDGRTWLSDLDAYSDPYTDVLEEKSAFLEKGSPRLWAHVVHHVSKRWTRYDGPAYIERG